MSTSVLDDLPTDWIDVWKDNDPRFVDLLDVARCADARRQLLRVPSPPTSDDLTWLTAISMDDSDDNSAPLPDVAIQALTRCLWSRWWTFEEAVRAALAVTDMLGCLGALRAWLEELALIEQVVPLFHGFGGGRAGARTAARLLLGRASDVEDQAAKEMRGRSTWLGGLVKPLHAYVHPDPGGHTPVVFPEDSRAMSLALQALVEVSDRTTMLGVLEPRPESTRTASADARLFIESLGLLVPVVEQIDVGPDGEALGHLASVRAGLVEACTDLRRLTDQYSEPDPRDPMGLRFGLPAGEVVWQSRRPELGFPQEPVTRLLLPMTRDTLRATETALARWWDGHDETAARLEYLTALCDAAVTVMLVKRNHYVEGLTRALLRDNPLATGLAARGLVEHHAAALYAAAQSAKALRGASRFGATAPELNDVERRLLRLLARPCSHDSDERRLCCRARMLGERDSPLREILEKAYPSTGSDAPFLSIWQRLSELVHGNTGALNARGSKGNDGVTRIGLFVLAEMLPARRTLDVVATYHPVALRLRTAQAAVSNGESLTQELRRHHVPPYLVPDRDYEGSGTLADPYRLLVGNHVDALEPLLKKIGMSGATRRMVFLPDWGIADELSLAGRVVHVVPAPGLLPPASDESSEARPD